METRRSPGDATRGLFPFLPHTHAMRQWACAVALILGLAGSGYAWTIRPRLPVPIERRISPGSLGRTTLTPDWWRR